MRRHGVLDESLYTTEDPVSAAPVEAGWYIVRVVSTDSRYGGSGAALMKISREVEITLGDLDHVYDGEAKMSSVAVVPADAAVTVTYDGADEAPVNAGEYAVVATAADLGYSGSATNVLTVAKAMATVTIDPASLDQAVNRLVPVTVTTDPAGLMVDVTYDGVPDVLPDSPGSVGEHAVVAVINDPNHAGRAEATLVIRKAVQDIAVVNEGSYQPWQVAMAGTPIGIPLYANAGSGEPVTYAIHEDDDAPNTGIGSVDGNVLQVTRPGDIRILVAQAGDSYWAPTEYMFTVTVTGVGQEVTIEVTDLDHVYDGTPKMVAVETVPADLEVTVTYDGEADAPSAAGEYEVVVTSANPVLPGSATETLTIAKAEAAVELVAESLSQRVDELVHVQAVTNPTNLMVDITYDGMDTLPTNDVSSIGDVAVVATVNDDNHMGSAEGVLVVGKASQAIVVDGKYDPWPVPMSGGILQVPLLASSDSGGAVSFVNETDAAVSDAAGRIVVNEDGNSILHVENPGVFSIRATEAGTDYHDAAELVFEVTVTGTRLQTEIVIGGLDHVYDGTARMVTLTTVPEDLEVTVTYDGEAEMPTDAGTYEVVATSDDTRFPGSATATLTITKAEAVVTIDADSLMQPVNGLVPVTATTDPAGLMVDVTYDGSAELPADEVGSIGDVAVVVTVNDTNYMGTAEDTLVVGKAVQTISVSDPGQYNPYGIPMRGAILEIPLRAGSTSGLPVTFTDESDLSDPAAGLGAIEGSILKAEQPGTFTIRADQAGTDYWEMADMSFEVTVEGEGLEISIDLGDLEHVYDGTSKEVTVATVPEDLEVTVTYDGEAEAPTDAGEYEVVATSADFRYPGETTGTLTIAKAEATVTIDADSLAQPVNGLVPVTATTDPAGLTVDVTYDGSAELPADEVDSIGEVAVVATVNDANYMGTAEATLVVGKAVQTIEVSDPAQYDPYGVPMRGAILEIPLRARTSSGLPAAFVNETDESSPALGIIDGSLLKAEQPGTFTIKAVQAGDDYYDMAELVFEVTVEGEGLEISIVLGDLEQVYDGTPREVSVVSTVPEDLEVTVTYDGGAEAPTDAGTYEVVATSTDVRYPGDTTATLTIAKAAATVTIDPDSLMQTVDALVPVMATTDPAGLTVDITYDGSAELPADEADSIGEVAVVATVNDANYMGSATAMLTIGKAPQTLTVPDAAQYDPWIVPMQGSVLEVTLRTVSNAEGVASYGIESTAPHESQTRDPEATIDGNTLMVSYPGTFTIKATHPGDDYHAEGEVAFDVVINGEGVKTAATLSLGSLDHVYDGSAKSAAVTVDPADLTVEVTYDGASDAPTDAGSYAVVATVEDEYHKGSATGTLTIAKATATVTIAPAGLRQIRNKVEALGITTAPAGLTVDVTYDGSAEVPQGVGSYAVVATVNEANYTGTAEGTLVVEKKAQTITITDAAGYNPYPIRIAGAPIRIPLEAISESRLEIVFTVDAVNASVTDRNMLIVTQPGSYTVMANQAGNDLWLAAPEVSLTVVVQGTGIPTIEPQVSVDGLEDGALTLDVTGAPNALVDILFTDDLIDGSYTVVRTIQLDVDGNGSIALPTLGGMGFYRAANHVEE